jgi:hypothetical protein
MKRNDSKVRFSESTALTIVEQAQDVIENKNEVWYSRDELKTLKSKSSRQKAGDDNVEEDDDDHAIDPAEEKRRSEMRQQFIRSILEQQSEQRKLGIDDPKGLRALSRAASKTSRKEAEEVAKINQSESLNGLSDHLLKKSTSRSGMRRSASSAPSVSMRRNASFNNTNNTNNGGGAGVRRGQLQSRRLRYGLGTTAA